jgi:hypothetical protein
VAQRELPQRDQVTLLEKVLDGTLRLSAEVDLAVAHPFEQLVGRQVDELQLVRLLEHRVRHGLTHADPGNFRDDVVQALDVLHVHRRKHVDAGVQELVDVLPALGVTRPLHVGVGQLVDQQQLRAPLQRSVQVELLDLDAAVQHPAAWQELEAEQLCARLVAPMRFHDADDDVPLLLLHFCARELEHRVGLAHARRGAEEDRELAAPFALLRRHHAAQ